MRRTRGGTPTLAAVFLGGVACCEAAGAWDVRLPVVMHPGNAAFGLLLVAAVAVEVSLMRRGGDGRRAYVYGAIASILAAFAIWNAAKAWLCDPDSLIQGHAAWHLLCAVSVYLLYRYYASERRSCGGTGPAHIVAPRP
ncbi:hypothetical protein [Dactylosporangium sp. NPDC005555]|uniref:hypothetical protein n=1 Tax=Dactylosporangium sp. NPDC005555 TaxID=3154889 RepID=UPI0033AC4347